MNKYEKAYLNVDTNSCDEEDCKILEQACNKADAFDEIMKDLILDIACDCDLCRECSEAVIRVLKKYEKRLN